MTEILKRNNYVSQERIREVFDNFNALESRVQMTEIDKRLVELVDKNLGRFIKNS